MPGSKYRTLQSPSSYQNKFNQEEFDKLKKSLPLSSAKKLLEKSIKDTDGGFTKFQLLSTMRYMDLIDDKTLISKAKPILKKELRKLRYLDQDTIDVLCQLYADTGKSNRERKHFFTL